MTCVIVGVQPAKPLKIVRRPLEHRTWGGWQGGLSLSRSTASRGDVIDSIVGSMPIVIVYILLLDYDVSGLTAGSVKDRERSDHRATREEECHDARHTRQSAGSHTAKRRQ